MTRKTNMTRTRDQERAIFAYDCVKQIRTKQAGKEQFDDYKSMVQDFGATVMRNGLAAALAFVARRKGEASPAFLAQLAGAGIPGLEKTKDGAGLLAAVCKLDVDEYMLATREVLHLAVWLRRAVQAADALDQQAARAAGNAGAGSENHA